MGSIVAGRKSNVILDCAVRQLDVRTYAEGTSALVFRAPERIVHAECVASGCPHNSEFVLFDRYPVTVNALEVTARVGDAFSTFFGSRAGELAQQHASEDFTEIPNDLGGVPYTYWGLGGIDF